MKVLIVGTGGYIGEQFAVYASKKFIVDKTDSYNGWRSCNFANYDAVMFAAGIAHRKQTKKNSSLYFAINRDLAIEVAQKAKNSNVPLFVYLSSMAVFGKKEGKITANTKPLPAHNDYYGQSKRQAELELVSLQTETFKTAIVRPPMVYGENCPGKYRLLEKLAKFLPFVPCNNNKRSVIHVDNLSEFLCKIIAGTNNGVFFHPQDPQYTSTSAMVAEIRRKSGKSTTVFKAGALIRFAAAMLPFVKTAYGTLYYE